ncbi:hypothetical protein BAE44_0026267 [Dichanthelium oligosanthes]|uniref:Uncharacterized protein n=1 Tax=Dichanthelium oligosanthes TaxID=888268 RepID=A0A1E5UIL4_9POAL|nr:hypothetical protein BAE44_0026267 [Dichanthelium oligosanthes]
MFTRALAALRSSEGGVPLSEMKIYFILGVGDRILKYDMGKHCLSMVDPPGDYKGGAVLVPMEDEGAGVIVRSYGVGVGTLMIELNSGKVGRFSPFIRTILDIGNIFSHHKTQPSL